MLGALQGSGLARRDAAELWKHWACAATARRRGSRAGAPISRARHPLRAVPAPAADARRARAGWQQAVRVSAAVDAYYPIGAAECCTPALLLETGDAWCVARRGAQLTPCAAPQLTRRTWRPSDGARAVGVLKAWARGARELERCGCTEAPDINCGGTATHQLLYGYNNFRRAPGGRTMRAGKRVPVGTVWAAGLMPLRPLA